jgi:protein-tyrosine phosphatase
MANYITIVCYANFCRSPVAEILLREKLPENFVVESAGLNPMFGKGMDQRSQHFLHNKGIRTNLHNPKRISKEMIIRSSQVFALDIAILQKLNSDFPKFSGKIKLLNFQQPKILLSDPFKMQDDEYFKIMERIESVCDNLASNL